MLLTGIGMMGYKLVVTQFTQSTCGLAARLCELSYNYHIHVFHVVRPVHYCYHRHSLVHFKGSLMLLYTDGREESFVKQSACRIV